MQWKNSLPFDESGGITPCNPCIVSAKTPWWATLWGVAYENKKKNERKLICVLKLKNIIFIHSYLISENFLSPVFKPEACFSKVQIMLLKKLLFLFFMITLFMNLIHKFIEKCYYEILWMTYCYQILQSHPFLAVLLSCAFPETKINWRE